LNIFIDFFIKKHFINIYLGIKYELNEMKKKKKVS